MKNVIALAVFGLVSCLFSSQILAGYFLNFDNNSFRNLGNGYYELDAVIAYDPSIPDPFNPSTKIQTIRLDLVIHEASDLVNPTSNASLAYISNPSQNSIFSGPDVNWNSFGSELIGSLENPISITHTNPSPVNAFTVGFTTSNIEPLDVVISFFDPDLNAYEEVSNKEDTVAIRFTLGGASNVFSIQAVPEPSTVLMGSLLLAGFGARSVAGFRKRRSDKNID